ncbi:MAG: hypothetical protein ABSC62_07455 [Terracidiphilus sp.]|jgi:hypothetical protein
MKKDTKLRLARWIAIPAIILGLRFLGGGRAWEYMVDHVWLTALLPLVALFWVLFVRGTMAQRRRRLGASASVGGAQGAKP